MQVVSYISHIKGAGVNPNQLSGCWCCFLQGKLPTHDTSITKPGAAWFNVFCMVMMGHGFDLQHA